MGAVHRLLVSWRLGPALSIPVAALWSGPVVFSAAAVVWPWVSTAPAIALLSIAVAVAVPVATEVVAGERRGAEDAPGIRRCLRAATVTWLFSGLSAWPGLLVRFAAVGALAVFWACWSICCLKLAGRGPGSDRAELLVGVVVGLAWTIAGALPPHGSLWSGAGLGRASVLLVATATLVVGIGRRRAVRNRNGPRPEVLVGVGAAGLAAVTTACTGDGIPRATGAADLVVLIAALSVPLTAVALSWRRRQVRAEVAEYLVRLGYPLSLAAVRDTISVVLRDPTLVVLHRPDETGVRDHPTAPDAAWVRVGPVGSPGERHRVPARTADGAVVAVLDCAQTVRRRPHRLDVVTRMCGPAVMNAQLHESSRARLEELSASRTRIVSAALDERRRLERDLHDGAQQRLLAVSAGLGLARATAEDPEALRILDEMRGQLRTILGELRALARDIHPAVLESAGLAAAVEASGSSLRIPLTVEGPGERFAPFAETLAYLTTHDLLTAEARAGTARSTAVRFDHEGTFLQVSICHVGSGESDGSAVEHASDRLRALGGSLRVDAGPDAVTIVAGVPCE